MAFDPSIFLSSLTSTSLIQGAGITIALTVVSFALGIGIGLVVAFARDHRWRVVRVAAWTYVWIFRAVPTLVQLLFVWNALPLMFPALKSTPIGQNQFVAAVIALSLNEGAYAAEIIRGGLLSIDDGQKLAARALGLSAWGAFRRVIAPQLARVVIPPMSIDFITLLKITSLASVISLRELLTNTQLMVASTFRFAELYAAVAVWYLVLVSIFMVVQSQIERRFVWESRRTQRGDGPRIRAGMMR
jgi:His/Glu/Gln/Arg/opine family amino acid ABC transporter permease subunit